MAEEGSVRLVLEAGGTGEGVDRAADGIGPEQHRALALHQFDAVDGIGIDGIPILHRSAAPGGVVDADAIDHQQVLAAGEATDEGRAVAVGGLLDQHPGRELEDIGQGPAGVLLDKVTFDPLHGVGDIGFGVLDPRRGGHQRIQQVLPVKGQRHKGKQS